MRFGGAGPHFFWFVVEWCFYWGFCKKALPDVVFLW